MKDIEDLIRESKINISLSEEFEDKVLEKIRTKKKKKVVFKAILSSLFIIALSLTIFLLKTNNSKSNQKFTLAKKEIIPISDKIILGNNYGDIKYTISIDKKKSKRRPL